ncbi:C39 family peptidase [Marinobacter sp.]|uniref:C39 family peptidase n=1 Tax=Marinobacter sp. TaxID=50741 RepID=UPI0019ADB7F0|nr:C39 family peptidase [Marinobacter sp.]MBC7191355.1 C39 family peptidase [Marinobacter sp.]
MPKLSQTYLLILSLTILTVGSVKAAEYAYVSNDNNLSGAIPVTSWKTLRDAGVVKQDLDYSCGAASIATILNGYYGRSVTEAEILDLIDNGNMRASFEDMAGALAKLGFRGVGYAASFEQLTKLKVPVVVYTKHRKTDHFSVIRGVNSDTVWMADPSLGNRTYSKHQFLEAWETRDDSTLKGKILAIIPADQEVQGADDFFTNQPRRQTAQAVKQQIFRGAP